MTLLSAELIARLEANVGRLIVGFSGGCDSHVLLHLLSTQLNKEVEALHVNHGLAEQADAWQQHCEVICDELNIPFTSFAVAVATTGSVETNARNARYAVFNQVLEAGDILLLGHHQDDQVETLLMNLFSGRGGAGLLGMPLERKLGRGTLLRPLLTVPRQAIETYAAGRGLIWIEDPSNADTEHTRNYLRHEVLPRLEQRWPNVKAQLEGQWQQLNQLINQVKSQAVADSQAVTLGSGLFDLAAMEELGPARYDACLVEMLVTAGYKKTPGARLLSEIRETLSAPARDESPAFDLASFYLQRYQNKLYLTRVVSPEPEAMTPATGESFSGGRISAEVIKGRGCTVPANQLQCQTRRGGETILIHGHHRALKKLFQELGVPPHVRDSLPLLWLDGICIGIPAMPDWGISGAIADPYRASDDQFGCEIEWSPPV